MFTDEFGRRAYGEKLTPFEIAMHYGMRFLWTRTQYGYSAFVARSFYDCQYSTNESGEPIRDFYGNDVFSFGIENLNENNREHLEAIMGWYSE